MEPTESYIICCVQRTGSWLLAHALGDLGRAGHPADYFDDAARIQNRSEWKLDRGDFASYLAAVTDRATTPNGVLGTKMMWNGFEKFRRELRELHPEVTSDVDLLSAAFPSPRFVWLRRQDKFRQGFSWWRATQTDQWHLPGTDEHGQPEIDLADALSLVRLAQDCEDGWREWFAENELSPIEVVYEDLEVNRQAVVERVLAHLGLPQLGSGELPAARYRRQADEYTERYVEALRAAAIATED